MNQSHVISVIIPTYNRKEALIRGLTSLVHQSLPPDCYEVIVVDDGSTDGTASVAALSFPFDIIYIRQDNQGAAAARNRGAIESEGKILLFFDDDVTISPSTICAVLEDCHRETKTIILGALTLPCEIVDSLFVKSVGQPFTNQCYGSNQGYLHFTECKTGLLALPRRDFFEIGMFQDPTGGWPNWDDLDFGYRAFLKGFRFKRNQEASGEHWDISACTPRAWCDRWYRASKSAVRLFQKYPELKPYIPMFHDKTPIIWRQDSPKLILRKSARRIASSASVLWGLERAVSSLESRYPSPYLISILYRFIIGAYMFRGFQEGLEEVQPLQTMNRPAGGTPNDPDSLGSYRYGND